MRPISALLSLKELIKISGIRKTDLVLITGSYCLITFFDVIGLGSLFLIISRVIGSQQIDSQILSLVPNFSDTTLYIAIVLAWTLKFFTVLVANLFLISFSQRVILLLRAKLVTALFGTPTPSEFLASRNVWLDTANRQLSNAAVSIIEPVLRGLFDFALLVLACVYVMLLAPLVFIFIGIWMTIGLIIFDRIIRSPIKENGYQYNRISEMLMQELVHISDGFQEFWTMKAHNFFLQRVNHKGSSLAKKYAIFSILTMSPRLFLEALLVIGVVLAIVVVESLLINPNEVLLSLAIVGVSALRIIPLVNSVSLGINQLRSGSRTIENLIDFSSFDRPNQDAQHNKEASKIVEINVASLSAKIDKKYLFEGLSFKVEPGTSVAIVGPSGCGKSTLLRMIGGIEAPFAGEIQFRNLEGVMIRPFPSFGKICLVGQNPTTVEGNLIQNLVLSTTDLLSPLKHDLLQKSLNISGFGKVVDTFSDGLSTNIGQMHRQLSGGEAYKLALSRALFQCPDVLLLDEPTAAFDSESAAYFFEKLHEYKSNRILMVVTHSEAHLKEFDAVIRLGKGTQVKFEKVSM